MLQTSAFQNITEFIIKENLKEIEDASKEARNKEIIEANGDKDKLKEIEKRHFKAVLELQSNYIADVLRENENLTDEQVKQIEDAANQMVKENYPVNIDYYDRGTAEQKYGFKIYQGGVHTSKSARPDGAQHMSQQF